MPIPANRVKDICFVHIHTGSPGAAEPGYAKKVLATLVSQPMPPSARVVCTRGPAVNQSFFATSLKKVGDEKRVNYLDKAQYTLHLEEFTDGQGGRGQVCIAIAKAVPGAQAVKCACGRMVNPGPKARCPYCGRAVVAGGTAAEAEPSLLDEDEPTVKVPALEEGEAAAPDAPPMVGGDLAARMSARARGAAARSDGGFVQEHRGLVFGGAALVVVALVWVLFLRGKGLHSEWKGWFEGCKWDPCIAELEKQVSSGAAADKPEMEFRLAQARLEKQAQSVNNPANNGPEVTVLQAQQITSGAETVFLLLAIDNTTAAAIDLTLKDFYLVMRPAAGALEIALAEPIEEAPFDAVSLSAGSRVKVGVKVPTPSKTINNMWITLNDGKNYCRTIVPQNFARMTNKSFLNAEWKPSAPEAVSSGPKPPATGTSTTPGPQAGSPPAGVVPQPPAHSVAMVSGSSMSFHGWTVTMSGVTPTGMISNTLTAGVGNQFFVVALKLRPDSDEASRWPVASSDFQLWESSGRTVPCCGGYYHDYKTPTGPKGIFAEWFQVLVGDAKMEARTVIDAPNGSFADRVTEAVPLKQEGEMEVAFILDQAAIPQQFSVVGAFGEKPAEPPSAPAGAFIGAHWTNRAQECKADAILLGDGRNYITKLATEDWEVKIAQPLSTELYKDKATLGDRAMIICAQLEVRPWFFRKTKAAAPPLETGGFGMRSPRGEETKPLGWIVNTPEGEKVVRSAKILGSDTEGESTVEVNGDEATLHIGQGGVGHISVILEGVKGQGDCANYMMIHGLKILQ